MTARSSMLAMGLLAGLTVEARSTCSGPCSREFRLGCFAHYHSYLICRQQVHPAATSCERGSLQLLCWQLDAQRGPVSASCLSGCIDTPAMAKLRDRPLGRIQVEVPSVPRNGPGDAPSLSAVNTFVASVHGTTKEINSLNYKCVLYRALRST
jgi:hypothetical protein